MTPEQQTKLRREWEATALAKRVESSELLAINHGFPEWSGQNIADYWLKIVSDAYLRGKREGEGHLEQIAKGSYEMIGAVVMEYGVDNSVILPIGWELHNREVKNETLPSGETRISVKLVEA